MKAPALTGEDIKNMAEFKALCRKAQVQATSRQARKYLRQEGVLWQAVSNTGESRQFLNQLWRLVREKKLSQREG